MEIISIAEEKLYENNVFPLTYEYKFHNDGENNSDTDGIIKWVASNTKTIDDLLLVHKAILFRLLYIIEHDEHHCYMIFRPSLSFQLLQSMPR